MRSRGPRTWVGVAVVWLTLAGCATTPVHAPRELRALPPAINVTFQVRDMVFTPDGHTLLVGGDAQLEAYDLVHTRRVDVPGREALHGAIGFAFMPGSASVLAVCTTRELVVFDLASGVALQRWTQYARHHCDLGWSADGARLLVATASGVFGYERASGVRLGPVAGTEYRDFEGGSAPLLSELFYVASGDRLLALAGVAKVVFGEAGLVVQPQPVDGTWSVLAVAANGARFLAVPTAERVGFNLWVADDRRVVIASLEGEPQRLTLPVVGSVIIGDRMSLSPDGRLALVQLAGARGTNAPGPVQLIDAVTGVSRAELPRTGIDVVAWQADSQRFAAQGGGMIRFGDEHGALGTHSLDVQPWVDPR